MKRRVFILALLAIWALGALALTAPSNAAHTVAIPVCEEDAVLVGAGDFIDGTWSRYECGPAVDDLR
jgi:hypothetical protein